MTLDFSKLDLKNPPRLLLCNADGTPFQYLGYAFNVEAEIHFNETSVLSFDYPAEVDHSPAQHYDDIVGMREIYWPDIGYFILNNPKEEDDGVRKIKTCTAYSAEYEFTYKQITLESGTYNFYNPVAVDDTILGRVMELMPGWSVGSVDSALVGKYRTFDDTQDNVYNFIKGAVQETFQCVFDFDILDRKVNVRSMIAQVPTRSVYIALENLAQKIEREEDTENIFTCLDVNGAEGVDIRSVNPMGINKIYDLSYFMAPGHVGQGMVDKYNAWKEAYENARLPYFNTTVEMVLAQARYETETAKLTALKGELSTLESLLSVYVEISASGDDSSKSDLTETKQKISAKEQEITAQKELLDTIQGEIDGFYGELKAVNERVAFKAFFTPEELKILDKYIKEDSIQDSTFVVSETTSYVAVDKSGTAVEGTLSLKGANITGVTTSSGKDIYTIVGGSIEMVVNGKMLTASVVRSAFDRKQSDGSFVFTAYLNRGKFVEGSDAETSFPSGCVSMTGTCGAASGDLTKDPETGAWEDGTALSVASLNGFWYLTENATEYQKRSIEWDLFDYGMEALERVSWPSYTFSVDSCNFLTLDEFLAFRDQLRLGEKIYLRLGEDVLEPILIGCEFSYEDISKLVLEFGDKYNSRDARFQLTDLLDQSISSGKSVDFSKWNYNAFVDSGANTSVRDFINSALDAAKNAVLAGADQAIAIDQSGIRLRKSNGSGGFEDEQIWMINNCIVFTDDNWNTVKLAIGKFTDPNTGEAWGIVAPSIVGTLLAGENLVIESAKKDGGTAVFRVDADGARLYNSRFDLVNEYGATKGQISMFSPIGLVAGSSTGSSPLVIENQDGAFAVRTESGDTLTSLTNMSKSDPPAAAFWLDMDGNAWFKGKIYATDGVFTGTVHATDGDFTGTVHATDGSFSGTIKASTLEGTLVGKNGGAITGVSLGIGGANYNNFVVDSDGNVTMRGNINLAGGNITWGSNLPDSGLSENEVIDLIDEYGPQLPNYIKSTYISSTTIKSPTFKGNNMEVYGAYKVLDGSDTVLGYMGGATGMDATGSITYGVALASSATTSGSGEDGITYATRGNYVIATSGGCRMQAGSHSLTVTSNGAFYDGVEIGTGSGGTAVWG